MRFLVAMLAVLAALSAAAAPTRVMVIGDSMSEEYANELPFSAPDSDPLEANTSNWIESLHALRSGTLDFGSEGSRLDLRGLGFEYNWGWPGATADFWAEVLNSSFINDPQYLPSKRALLGDLDRVDVAVLFVGGNDMSSDYYEFYHDAPTPGFKEAFLNDITFIINSLRSERPDIPIVLVNAPDIGATPRNREIYPDPAKRLTATGHIADVNTRLAADHAAEPNLVIVDLFALTALMLDPAPFTIGPVTMIKSYDRENRPNFLFCKEKFHPASGASALIGNAIVGGINQVLGTTIVPLTDTEIAGQILGLQPYLDWMATFPGADPDLLADPDHDGLPHIGEFALGTHPLKADAPHLTPGIPATITFTPIPTAAGIVQTVPEESTKLQSWSLIPPARLTSNPDGSTTATLPSTPQAFARLTFPLAP